MLFRTRNSRIRNVTTRIRENHISINKTVYFFFVSVRIKLGEIDKFRLERFLNKHCDATCPTYDLWQNDSGQSGMSEIRIQASQNTLGIDDKS